MTQPSADPTPPANENGRKRSMLVVVLIGCASLLFLATAAVLYYRWATMNEPNCVLVIDTAPPLRGAEITVDSVMFTEPLKMTIGENNRYSIPFFVDPGEYSVKVMLAGEVQYEAMVTLSKADPGKLLNLTKLKPTTMPVSEPATGGT